MHLSSQNLFRHESFTDSIPINFKAIFNNGSNFPRQLLCNSSFANLAMGDFELIPKD